MGEATWRVLVSFTDHHDAGALADRLGHMRELSAAGGSISHSSHSNDVFVYAETRETIEHVARCVRSSAEALGIKASGTSVDEWIPDESRWSGDGGDGYGGTSLGGGATSEIVTGIIDALLFNRR